MELSKEVYGLIEHIQKLSTQTSQKQNATYNKTAGLSPKNACKNYDMSSSGTEDIIFNFDELIPVENMDFSDDERWLYTSDNPSVLPFTGDLKQWFRQDFSIQNGACIQLPLQAENDRLEQKRFIDTRTYTRPKKRSPRPGLENVLDGFLQYNRSTDEIKPLNDDVTDGNTNQYSLSTPLQFKLSEPVYNNSFDRILATASDCIDSFQNMSPPSLMNSLCSSTFTTLMDSGYVNQEVPTEPNEVYTNEIVSANENVDPNVTYTTEEFVKPALPEKYTKPTHNTLNNTYDMKNKLNNVEQINSTFSMGPETDFNATYNKKNVNNKTIDDIYKLNGSNTFTKKSKEDSVTNDLNRTFKKTFDMNFDRTFQKLSDSQPNLTENLKQTILNQSMELMNPTIDSYRSTKSGSADSLDERSSSISNSSKGSCSKVMNMSDLDNLARMQEQSLQQVMSTPKMNKPHIPGWDGEMSPIQNRLLDEQYLSDSDMSDTGVVAKGSFSKRSSASLSPKSSPIKRSLESISKPDANTTRPLPDTVEVSEPALRPVPAMVVKPADVTRALVHPSSAPVPSNVRPRLRASALPRPTGMTGIPRPAASRIPGPKSARPQLSRPSQRVPPKADWMDGCY